MVLLECTLQPPSCARLHDALLCLAKFGEYVSLEARHGQLTLTALNSSKSAYVSFKLEANTFFYRYDFQPDDRSRTDRFSCRILNKALLSVFKAKMVDSKGGNPNFERAEISLEDKHDKTQCRLVVRLFNRHGVTKTYKLTYEPVDMMHALFNKDAAEQRFKLHSSLLREYMEFFGPKTEQLNICREEDRVTLTSYTEKIVYGKEVLKQPLQTSVSIDTRDFDEVEIEEELHIGISVKDFKNIVMHADTLRTSVSAMYSVPGRPLQFSYSAEGLLCEYTLMTLGEARPANSTAQSAIARTATREPSLPHPSAPRTDAATSMQPPASRPASRPLQGLGSRQPSQAPQSARGESPLFVPAEDDDKRWDPADEQEEEQAMLGWDASADNVSATPDQLLLTGLINSRTSSTKEVPSMMSGAQQHGEIHRTLRECM